MSDLDSTLGLGEYDQLPLRERQELASALRIGVASPFWSAYRTWLEDQFQATARELIPPCTDIGSILRAENLKGRLGAFSRIIEAPAEFLALLDESIAAETQEPSDARADEPHHPFDDSPQP